MCVSCWESMGSLQVWGDEVGGGRVGRAAQLVGTVYQWHSAGGPLHMVLDNWNISDGHLEYCARVVADPEQWDDEDCEEYRSAVVELVQLLGEMSEVERASALALADGYWPRAPWEPPPLGHLPVPGESAVFR